MKYPGLETERIAMLSSLLTSVCKKDYIAVSVLISRFRSIDRNLIALTEQQASKEEIEGVFNSATRLIESLNVKNVTVFLNQELPLSDEEDPVPIGGRLAFKFSGMNESTFYLAVPEGARVMYEHERKRP